MDNFPNPPKPILGGEMMDTTEPQLHSSSSVTDTINSVSYPTSGGIAGVGAAASSSSLQNSNSNKSMPSNPSPSLTTNSIFNSAPLGASNIPVAARIGVGSDGGVKVQMPSSLGAFQPTGGASSSPTPSISYTSTEGQMDATGFALSDLLLQLEDYPPTIPDAVANHYLHLAGFEATDPRMSRLLSIASQKFLSDIINEAFTHCKLKGQVNQAKTKVKDKKYTLTMEDLIPVLNEHGITIKKPPYYT